MKTIEPHISAYIDTAIERQGVAFNATVERMNSNMQHQTGVLIEAFQDQLKIMGETLDARIISIVDERVTPRFDSLEYTVGILVKEVGKINKKIDNHEHRIVRLEKRVA